MTFLAAFKIAIKLAQSASPNEEERENINLFPFLYLIINSIVNWLQDQPNPNWPQTLYNKR